MELTGSPRVQQGLDTHIATSPDTVMILNQDGHLTTHGPSRTEIRQDKDAAAPGAPAGAAATPRAEATATGTRRRSLQRPKKP